MSRRVVIAQYRLLHYRVELFERMRKMASEADIDLRVVHGQATKRESKKNDVGELPWADVVSNRYVTLRDRDLVWQPIPRELKNAELLVLMQESRLLSNYPYLFGKKNGNTRVAFWGHGRNFQARRSDGFRERFKQSYIGNVDWWFAYTSLTRSILLRNNYPDSRITVLNNAIDNEGFLNDLSRVDESRLDAMRRELGLSFGAPLGLFCGSLYPDKKLDLLIETADFLHSKISGFRLVVIGDGPSAGDLRHAAGTRDWLRCVGALRGREKAAYFKLADVVLNPGAVGLHVLDSFCSGAPLLTTEDAFHGPEIAYLESGVNGVVTSGGSDAYSAAALSLLCDNGALASMKQSALLSAEAFTLEQMVKNFVLGICDCLNMPRLHAESR